MFKISADVVKMIEEEDARLEAMAKANASDPVLQELFKKAAEKAEQQESEQK